MKSFAEVRAAIGGLKGLLTKLGDNPQHEHKWKTMPSCPFCKNKDCAGIYSKGGVEMFKCHKSGCCSGNQSMTEVGYIAAKEGLSNDKPAEGGPSPAYRRLLELAGCWEEPKPREEKKAAPPKPKVEPPKVDPTPPAASPVPPVPPVPSLSNPVLPEEIAPGEKDDEEMLMKCIEIIRSENRVSFNVLKKHLGIGAGRAARMIDELHKRGIIGPANGQEPREIIKLPPKPADLIVIKVGDDIHIEKVASPAAAAAEPAKTEPAKEVEKDGKDGTRPPETKPEVKPEENPKLPLGLAALRAFYEKLFPTESQMVPYLEKGIWFCEKCGLVLTAQQCKKCEKDGIFIERVPDPLPAAIAKRLKFERVSLFEKRCLTSVTCEALGLRANPPENEGMIQDLQDQFSWEELRASGLWLEPDKKRKLARRPNAQFHGKGQIGKKPDRERKGKDDKWVWGFGWPVLIPYFDEAGDLVKLRPHKGGAPAGTMAGRPRIYVPRDFKNCADMVEFFYEVIICEGEYKAMALWQTLGRGAPLQTVKGQPMFDAKRFEAIGVCALPGISYVTNVEMRMDLERWLKAVGCRRVIVAFDDEDKSDKPLRQRFDAQRDARVLATELSQLLHIEAKVCVLPREWRNSRGKADWDGALEQIVNQKKQNV